MEYVYNDTFVIQLVLSGEAGSRRAQGGPNSWRLHRRGGLEHARDAKRGNRRPARCFGRQVLRLGFRLNKINFLYFLNILKYFNLTKISGIVFWGLDPVLAL